MSRDYRDDVIAQLAHDESARLERIVDLTIERDSWQLVAQQAIHYIAELTQQLGHVRATYRRLRDERRAERTQREAA